MSTSDESELAERNRKPTEVLDDDVTVISVSNPYGQLKSILLRVLLAIIFLGMGVGAVVYSVYNSEKSSNAESVNTTIAECFSIHMNQACDDGTFTIERIPNVTNSSDVNGRGSTTIGATWIQDDTHRRLYLRLGLTPHDWLFTDFVHPTFTVRSMKNNCTKNYGVTYDSYITSLGVTHLKKRNHQGNVFIDGKYHSAVVYDGAPDASVVAHNVHPAVVFAYMNPNNGATFGWEMFFPRTVISSIFRAEFWFANMKISSRDANVFFNYPVECELSIINITKQSLFDELFIGRK